MDTPVDTSEQQQPLPPVEPSLHFVARDLTIGAGSTAREVTVSELVDKDQLLLNFPATDPNIPAQVRLPIALGDHCYMSEDENSVYSAIRGYPRIFRAISSEHKGEAVHISIEPLFRISADRMKGSIAVHPPLLGHGSLQGVDLRELFHDEGFVHGLIEENIQLLQEAIDEERQEFNVIVIATGKKPIHGKDAYLKFAVETGPIPGKLLKDGTIDFRERKIFVPVTAGQIIATKIAPTPGNAGKTIFGETIPPRAGNDIAVNTLKDASYSSKTKKVTADANGVLSVVGDTIIKVCSRQEIMTDIDYGTGHIESRNTVLVHGSVQPGFRVIADGDLEIRGSVMSTSITSDSNIVVKSGITGKNTKVSARGDIDLYFIEQGHIEAGNNCIIRKQSYYSTILVGGNICLPQTAVVVGGSLIASGNLTLGNVGTTEAKPATIAAGVVGARSLQYKELHQRLIELQESLIQLVQVNKVNARSRKVRRMEKEIEQTKLKLLRLNLIPGTGLFSRASEAGEISGVTAEDYSREGGIEIGEISIAVHGIIFAGTIIQIGNHSMTLEHTIANRLFKLNDSLTDVAAFPLKKR